MKPAIPPVNVIVEGITDEAVACRLLEMDLAKILNFFS